MAVVAEDGERFAVAPASFVARVVERAPLRRTVLLHCHAVRRAVVVRATLLLSCRRCRQQAASQSKQRQDERKLHSRHWPVQNPLNK